MQFKKLMLVLTLTVSIIFVTVIGSTFAYYNISAGSVSGTTGSVEAMLGVVFSNSDYIDLNTGIPISSSEVETKACKVSFTLTPSSNLISDYDVNTDINLSNIDIDTNLKTDSFKYRLKCIHSITGTEQIFNGNASGFNSSSYAIASLSSTSSGNTTFYIDRNANYQNYSCTIYMWLEESGQNQNSLMGKHFWANIEVNTMVKKR